MTVERHLDLGARLALMDPRSATRPCATAPGGSRWPNSAGSVSTASPWSASTRAPRPDVPARPSPRAARRASGVAGLRRTRAPTGGGRRCARARRHVPGGRAGRAAQRAFRSGASSSCATGGSNSDDPPAHSPRCRQRDLPPRHDGVPQLALMHYQARDGFAGLRHPTDIAAWWDAHGDEVRSPVLEPTATAHPALRRARSPRARSSPSARWAFLRRS
jgi:hypothetical protein